MALTLAPGDNPSDATLGVTFVVAAEGAPEVFPNARLGTLGGVVVAVPGEPVAPNEGEAV